MPYKSEKIKLKPEQDRRRKLTEEQKEEILHKYATGLYGQRPLAKEYEVSRSTIQLIVNSQRREAVKKRIKEHWQDYRPSKEKWAAIQKEHRQYKHKLYLKGELEETK